MTNSHTRAYNTRVSDARAYNTRGSVRQQVTNRAGTLPIGNQTQCTRVFTITVANSYIVNILNTVPSLIYTGITSHILTINDITYNTNTRNYNNNNNVICTYNIPVNIMYIPNNTITPMYRFITPPSKYDINNNNTIIERYNLLIQYLYTTYCLLCHEYFPDESLPIFIEPKKYTSTYIYADRQTSITCNNKLYITGIVSFNIKYHTIDTYITHIKNTFGITLQNLKTSTNIQKLNSVTNMQIFIAAQIHIISLCIEPPSDDVLNVQRMQCNAKDICKNTPDIAIMMTLKKTQTTKMATFNAFKNNARPPVYISNTRLNTRAATASVVRRPVTANANANAIKNTTTLKSIRADPYRDNKPSNPIQYCCSVPELPVKDTYKQIEKKTIETFKTWDLFNIPRDKVHKSIQARTSVLYNDPNKSTQARNVESLYNDPNKLYTHFMTIINT